MQFKISKELLVQIEQLIQDKNDKELEVLLNDLHHADIAEIFDELNDEDNVHVRMAETAKYRLTDIV